MFAMPAAVPIWRHFQDLSSPSESASASASCNYSLGTLEVSCRNPGLTRFAVTEQRHMDNWRWAIFSMQGSMLGTGCEVTQALAKTVAEQALEATQTKAPFSIEEGIF
jgi:hypothetical protein